jgi:hypothetical protein
MRRTKTRRANQQKTKLGFPDLEHVKSAVLVSLRSPESQRSYRRTIDDFLCWYCSEPRPSFNKTVVTRHRIHLEDKLLAAGTIKRCRCNNWLPMLSPATLESSCLSARNSSYAEWAERLA